MKIIDPHLHLFDLTQGQYHWLRPENPPNWPDKSVIQQNFNEHQLALDSPLTLVGFVHIEAGFDNVQPWRELQWLEANCQLPFKAVACANIGLPTEQFIKQISQLQQQKSLIGIRHILDDDAVTLLSKPQAIDNFNYLAAEQLSFDCQLSFADDAAIIALCQVLTQIPELVCIINHAGFAPLTTNTPEFHGWHHNLQRLAKFPQVVIKCSGWEMQNRHYQASAIKCITETCINVFGISRVMLASNFPLTLFSCSYQGYWHQISTQFQPQLLENLCYNNSKNWYKLDSISIT
ncbi:amidohydrolase [Thalassotalea insulae]|uniref:Amidohydrolase n=1 Tax=Thalassotalea insulae TaxID=2056778 RepID=A0ABQ6GNI0_9GAMM|nr:amidohydrolase family protein [Thalassotalea insulae]GLX77487.1 amidohydrolase [Thalassotalea insulae]